MLQALVGRLRQQSTQQIGNFRNRIPPTDKPSQGHIPIASLRKQAPAWATAGGGMYATLHGVYKMLRSFRQLKYI